MDDAVGANGVEMRNDAATDGGGENESEDGADDGADDDSRRESDEDGWHMVYGRHEANHTQLTVIRHDDSSSMTLVPCLVI